MIGIIGGSGFYSLLEGAEEKDIVTPYGKTSSPVMIVKINGKDVAFIARHGLHHEYPPHKVPYKANIFALYELGVRQIFSASAVGSLKTEIKPGDFCVPDQSVNFTHGRDDTYYHGKESLCEDHAKSVVHISSADPFCHELRNILIKAVQKIALPVHEKGTIVVINGPRYSSRAESTFFRTHNWEIIGMTLYPEYVLARELEMCYANISLVTDYDTGVHEDPSIEPVSSQEVIQRFKENSEKIKNIILNAIEQVPEQRNCVCANALEGARM
ncbi:S-methyl-5'-thioadenosine phosphorylase [Candidatus Woesearchaeota archaeon]|nr:S-methyl-5'-thioadenosine phosphorylase [Candidatus Woesearchaeota archaeon]